MPENRTTNSNHERQTQRATILAALGGALIGALTGFAGSILTYNSAEHTRQDQVEARQAEDAEHRADVRREAYVGLSTSTHNYMQQATEMLSTCIDPKSGEEDRRRQWDSKYAAASKELNGAVAAAFLVTTEQGRHDLDKLGIQSTHLGQIIGDAHVKGPENLDAAKASRDFIEALKQHVAALQTFMKRAAAESL
ncbi:hypothetical protein ABT236_30475 [Streptomyces sp. NPDC001523]|uniref:hypothetical protein n=1 Tax=Streptomyces sp. NPDC001523 TaxID=3154383 RepID=UPI00332B0639